MSNSTSFVLYSTTSRNGAAGLRPQVMWASDNSIVQDAALEMNRSGETLEGMAGIEWVEDADGNMQPARELTCDEVRALSIAKLGDDGRLYAAFSTDEAGGAAFIEAAGCHGIQDQARALVEGSINSTSARPYTPSPL